MAIRILIARNGRQPFGRDQPTQEQTAASTQQSQPAAVTTATPSGAWMWSGQRDALDNRPYDAASGVASAPVASGGSTYYYGSAPSTARLTAGQTRSTPTIGGGIEITWNISTTIIGIMLTASLIALIAHGDSINGTNTGIRWITIPVAAQGPCNVLPDTSHPRGQIRIDDLEGSDQRPV